MSQGLRDMLANRRFAIPLIILLAFCFVGLILVGIVLILRPGASDNGEPVAQATETALVEPTDEATSTPLPTDTPTPRPSPTLVPVGTTVSSTGGESEATPEGVGTPVSSGGEGEATAKPEEGGTEVASSAQDTPEPTEETEGAAEEATATTTPPQEEELAQTGVGWGLILASAVGLGLLVIAARRLRMAN